MNKQVQAGKAKNFSEAFDVVFSRPGASKFYFASWMLGRKQEFFGSFWAAEIVLQWFITRNVGWDITQNTVLAVQLESLQDPFSGKVKGFKDNLKDSSTMVAAARGCNRG